MLEYPTLGTDPEQAILDPEGKPVPAHKFFPYKDNPIDRGDHKVYRDGYMVEYAVTPDPDPGVVTARVYRAMGTAKSMIPKGFKLASVPALQVNLDFLAEEDTPGDVMLFGCEPSINAYTLEAQVPAIDAVSHPWRYSGDHLHFGAKYSWVKKIPALKWFGDQDNQILFVKLLDRYLGKPLTFLQSDPLNYERRKYYGKAGEFRFQHYDDEWFGVEYRTPAGGLFTDPTITKWAFNKALYVFHNFNKLAKAYSPEADSYYVNFINTGRGK